MEQALGGADKIPEMFQTLVNDHSKPGARELLQRHWEAFMETYVPPPAAKRGRKATLEGHGSQHIVVTQGGAASAGAAAAGGRLLASLLDDDE